MKTFQQFQLHSQQLDENYLSKNIPRVVNKLPIVKNIKRSITKTPVVKKVMNVIKNLRTKPKPSDYVRMYHGTTEKAAKNILKKGMRGSSKNALGDGVYDNSAILRRRGFITDDPEIGRQYTMIHQYHGKKPDIVAVKVLKKNLKKGNNPGEYTAPVKDIKPVARGVNPIETRKGQVVQDEYMNKSKVIQEAKFDKLFKKYGPKVIKAIRNKRLFDFGTDMFGGEDGANAVRDAEHLIRTLSPKTDSLKSIRKNLYPFEKIREPDTMSKLAIQKKSIYPPDVSDAKEKITRLKVEVQDRKEKNLDKNLEQIKRRFNKSQTKK